MPTVTVDIRPEYIRAAVQSAAGRGLKFPSIEAERHVAEFLSGVSWSVVEPVKPQPVTEKYIIEIYWEPLTPECGRWDRSSRYPDVYDFVQAEAIVASHWEPYRKTVYK